MTNHQAQATGLEMTNHITKRLQGIPGVTTNALAGFVFGWLRKEQPRSPRGAQAGVVLEIIQAGMPCPR